MKAKKKEIKLPDKLSELLRLAVKDARSVAKMKTRKLDMSKWHDPISGKCHVCMAGAVMDRTLRFSPAEEVSPSDYSISTADSRKLYHINEMRIGEVPGEVTESIRCAFNKIVDADFSPGLHRASWRTYLKAADLLEEHGL